MKVCSVLNIDSISVKKKKKKKNIDSMYLAIDAWEIITEKHIV